MQVRISPSGNEQMAAWREGTHDDLVFAVALACWNAQNAYPSHPAGAEQWWTNEREAEAARILRKWAEGYASRRRRQGERGQAADFGQGRRQLPSVYGF